MNHPIKNLIKGSSIQGQASEGISSAATGSANGKVQQATQAASVAPDTATAALPADAADDGSDAGAQSQRVNAPTSHVLVEQDSDELLIMIGLLGMGLRGWADSVYPSSIRVRIKPQVT